MSDHATKAVDAVARATSRRGFLGQVARLAGGAAAGLAAVLAGKSLQAGGKILCCRYITPETVEYFVCRHNKCPETMGSRRRPDWLTGYREISDCSECGNI